MPQELICPPCSKPLPAESPGTVIRCPHCGAELRIRDDGTAEAIAVQPKEAEGNAEEITPVTAGETIADDETAFPGLPEQPQAADFPVEEIPREFSPFTDDSVAEADKTAKPPEAAFEAVQPTDAAIDIGAAAEGAPESFEEESVTSESAPAQAVTESPVATVAVDGRPRTVSWSLFVLVASYASAVTIAFVLYLWMTLGTADPHQLESLPDVVPKEQAEGEIERIVVSEDAPMPRGHTLRLGETRRFGDLEVTPLRVTRGPLEFVHHTGDESRRKPPTPPVLKLWLKLKNVSADQQFVPLGAELVFYRGTTERFANRLRANNFVCRVSEKKPDGEIVLLFDHVVEDVWDLKGQHINRSLQPGEEFVTYLPCSPQGLDQLNGEILWRVHFRKGLNAETGWGITTLIEVRFHSDDIEPDDDNGATPPAESCKA